MVDVTDSVLCMDMIQNDIHDDDPCLRQPKFLLPNSNQEANGAKNKTAGNCHSLSLSLVPFVCCCFPSFTADCFSFLHLCPSWPLVSLLASFCAFHSVQDTLGMPRQPARANMSVDYDHSFVNKSRRAIEKEFDGRFVRTKRAGGLFGQSGFAHTHTQ